MQGRGGRGPVKGAPERLAVQGHHALTALGKAAHEGQKTRLELRRIEQPKHARERVMAWDAMPEREDLFEEGVLGARTGPCRCRSRSAPRITALRLCAMRSGPSWPRPRQPM